MAPFDIKNSILAKMELAPSCTNGFNFLRAFLLKRTLAFSIVGANILAEENLWKKLTQVSITLRGEF